MRPSLTTHKLGGVGGNRTRPFALGAGSNPGPLQSILKLGRCKNVVPEKLPNYNSRPLGISYNRILYGGPDGNRTRYLHANGL